MGNRTFYSRDDKLWTKVQQFAKSRDISVSRVVENALRSYIASNENDKRYKPCPVCGELCGYWNEPVSCGNSR